MTHPLAAYHFQVDWGGTRLGFSEVTGLTTEIGIIEYREGNSKEPHPIKVPGMHKFGNITLKRGIVLGDNEYFAWLKQARFGTADRRDITISLLDEDHAPTVTWKVKQAWPIKLAGPDLDGRASEVAIEELVITHEGLTIEHG